MAQDNEYIEKGQPKKKKEKTTKKVVNQNKTAAQKEGNLLQTIALRFNKKKVKSTVGSLLILFSFFLFIALFSYLLTWQDDQDKVIGKGFFEFIFSTAELEVENWLGKFGAWISHLFIYRWFGLASFGFTLIFFVLGVRLLFNASILPLRKTLFITALYITWGSLFLGFFSDKINFLGGAFGYHLNDWLFATLGKFGTMTFTLVMLYIVTVIAFNPDFKSWFNRLKRDEEELDENEQVDDGSFADIRIVNTIRDEEIQEDQVSETVNFSEEEEEEESEVIDEFDLNDDSFEIEVPKEEMIPSDSTNETDDESFDVALAEGDEELDDDSMDALRKEFGDYDPTLELSSYVLPSIDLLNDYGGSAVHINKQELEENKNRIVETLSNYKIEIAKIKATVGPTVTLYEIVPAPGVRISKIKNLEDDIALSLSALGIRIIAPIPGKGTIGIEVPNSKPDMVSMRSLIASEKFQNSDAELPVVMGKTITNETYTFDLTKMPHLLVAGATGQGKSVGLNAILVSILYKKHPAQVKFVLVDPKKVELTLYNKIERHFLAKLPGEGEAIITDTSKVVNTLNSLCIEMDDRYALLKEAHCRTIKEYNAKFIARKLNPEKGHRYMPYIVVLIDEFADLIMTAGKEVEHPIARIAQLARAIGIHLIVATQRPSVNVITGMIKANFPARIAFRVLSKIDSRTILDASGADQLIGRGDMLVSTGSDLVRLQCGFVDTPEVEDICSFIGDQRAYPEALLLPEYVGEGAEGGGDMDMDDIDPLFADAARIVVIHQQGSASLLQRKLKLGYNRAGRIVDQLEGMGIIGPFQGSKAREVLFADEVGLDEFLGSKGIV